MYWMQNLEQDFICIENDSSIIIIVALVPLQAVSNDVTALKDGNEDNIEAEPTKADVGEVDAGDIAEDDDYEEAAVYGNDEAQDYLQVEGLSPFGLQDMDAEEEYYDEY